MEGWRAARTWAMMESWLMELTELELTLVTLDPLEPEEEDETEDDPLLEF